jgi:hypothetical protein
MSGRVCLLQLLLAVASAVILESEFNGIHEHIFTYLLTCSVALVRKRTIPTERPPLVGEVSANFCGEGAT